MQLTADRSRQQGVTLLEVLVSIVIMSVGLLGLAGLMTVASRSEMEGYQRIQALVYLNDMTDRIATNRQVANCYVSSDYGVGTLPACSAGTLSQQAVANADIAAWDTALKGGGEKLGTTNAGGIVGARGCVELIAGTTTDYRVSVAWQGLESVSAPDASLACGQGSYGSEAQRRVVSTILRIPIL